MLVLTNLEPTSTFSVRLLGKIKFPDKSLFLKLVRQADLVETLFTLTNESTDINFYTFTIPTSNLFSGDYDAYILNGDYVSGFSGSCYVDVPILIEEPEFFSCDPVTVETTIILESIMQVGIGGTQAVVILPEKGRVFGVEQTFYTNNITNNYTVYEG